MLLHNAARDRSVGKWKREKVKIIITITLMGFTVFTVNDGLCPSTLTSSKEKKFLALILESGQWHIRQQQAVFLLSWLQVNVFLHAILVIDPADLT